MLVTIYLNLKDEVCKYVNLKDEVLFWRFGLIAQVEIKVMIEIFYQLIDISLMVIEQISLRNVPQTLCSYIPSSWEMIRVVCVLLFEVVKCEF